MRIIIVEDELLTRDFIRKLCVNELRQDVVGETSSVPEAVSLILRLLPDVVILDLNLSDGTGFEVIERTHQETGASRFLIISGHCEEYTAYRLDRVHVHAFIDKAMCPATAIGEALRALERGERYLSPVYLKARMDSLTNQHSFLKLLSNQELIVLSLLGAGLDDLEVAQRLGIAHRTVQTHRANLSRKLEIHDLRKLVVFSQKTGLAPFPSHPPAGG